MAQLRRFPPNSSSTHPHPYEGQSYNQQFLPSSKRVVYNSYQHHLNISNQTQTCPTSRSPMPLPSRATELEESSPSSNRSHSSVRNLGYGQICAMMVHRTNSRCRTTPEISLLAPVPLILASTTYQRRHLFPPTAAGEVSRIYPSKYVHFSQLSVAVVCTHSTGSLRMTTTSQRRSNDPNINLPPATRAMVSDCLQ